jgi:hypothetical protein
VVSAVALEVPDHLLNTSLWKLLSDAVSRQPGVRRHRIAVADSKLLYHGLRDRNGLIHLERGVLAFLAATGLRPASVCQFLEAVSPGASARAASYPWYRDLRSELPRTLATQEVCDAGARLAESLRASRLRLLSIRTEVVFVEEFNRLIEVHGNKAAAHFEVFSRLVEHLCLEQPVQAMSVHVDRHGGRKYYLELLRQLWATAWIWVVDENPQTSHYQVADGDRQIEIRFTVGCEQHQLPVALASMVSKYLRELLMERLNGFWLERLPSLVPTAGYAGDGSRFFREIQGLLTDVGASPDWILRSR